MATLNGTIKRLVGDKGFGFIASGDSEVLLPLVGLRRDTLRQSSRGTSGDVRTGAGSERPEG